ncbi:ABC transporter permease [Labrys wisconsinensis]|uniref:Spermidine/putrescine transport system permease protein/spermidine/putrescine transport system permease protein n=1 Tax=Labrys wisconsinensis TaxID=425677 RepID=A0ABU0JI20_9HYPH|nr:ABC transporter permease [Labrys wisconsinensis]MDQ0472889.1 putative spermidine/putrescine transport system permease protein/spermidine/putrescine transport system permease protein [Labrys wisconsinensis]
MTRTERITLGVLWLFAGFVFLLLYGPALLVVVLSFFDIQRGSVVWTSFSFQHYAALAQNRSILSALGNTLLVAGGSVTSAMALALAIAWYMRTGERRGRAYVELVIFLPFVLPAIVTGISLLITFRQLGVERSLFTVAVGHVAIVISIIYRLVMVRLEALPTSQLEASADLGARPFTTFRLVVLPQLASAMITSALLALTISLDETLVTFFLAGGDPTLPLRLWAMMRVGFSSEINALVSIVLLITTIAASIGALLLRRSFATRQA